MKIWSQDILLCASCGDALWFTIQMDVMAPNRTISGRNSWTLHQGWQQSPSLALIINRRARATISLHHEFPWVQVCEQHELDMTAWFCMVLFFGCTVDNSRYIWYIQKLRGIIYNGYSEESCYHYLPLLHVRFRASGVKEECELIQAHPTFSSFSCPFSIRVWDPACPWHCLHGPLVRCDSAPAKAPGQWPICWSPPDSADSSTVLENQNHPKKWGVVQKNDKHVTLMI